MLITSEMTINEIAKKYPQTSKIFLEYGLFCFGCAASSIETLKQGILGHGIDEDTFEVILEKLNAVAKEPPKEQEEKKFEISGDAVTKLLEVKDANPKLKDKSFLRISAKQKEQYDLEYVEKKKEEDIIFYRDDLKIIIDKNSFENLKNIILNYKKSEHGEGFTFEKVEP